MKNVKGIRMLVKKVSYQEVLVNESDYDVGDLNDPMNLVEVVEEMKELNMNQWVSDVDWSDGEMTLEQFEILTE